MSEIPSTVDDIMIKDPVTVESKTSARDAVKIMAEKNIGALIVVSDTKPIGVFTERDILMRCATNGQIPDSPVSELMTTPVIACGPDTPVLRAFILMYENKIRRLPVVKDGRLVGLIIDKTLIYWVLKLLRYL